jgi:hypothetical protein
MISVQIRELYVTYFLSSLYYTLFKKLWTNDNVKNNSCVYCNIQSEILKLLMSSSYKLFVLKLRAMKMKEIN